MKNKEGESKGTSAGFLQNGPTGTMGGGGHRGFELEQNMMTPWPGHRRQETGVWNFARVWLQISQRILEDFYSL
jgi:hypothetical protein